MDIAEPSDLIDKTIRLIRGQRVILDKDLAAIYGVTTKRLNEQVRRNRDRFPSDFMFQLNKSEAANPAASRLQNATLKRGANIKYLPLAFTEHGAIMAANVLNSRVAVHASIQVVRAFVRLRQLLRLNHDLSQRLDEMERRYDSGFRAVFMTIRRLMNQRERPKPKMGFLSTPPHPSPHRGE